MKNSILISLSLFLSTTLIGQTVTSMDDVAARWKDGSYASRSQNSGIWEPMASGKSDIKFLKGTDGKITSIEIDANKYAADVSASLPFVMNYSSGTDRLYLTEKEKLERQKKYSLEGKEVVKVEIINIKNPEKFGHFRGFTYDVVATLKDDSKISNEGSSQGYLSDYNITYSAANYTSGSIASGLIAGDKIKITSTSKFNAKNTDTIDNTVLYRRHFFQLQWN